MQQFEEGIRRFEALQAAGAEIPVPGMADGSLPACSALETLTLDGRFASELRKLIPRLEALTAGYQRDDRRGYKQSARSLLVNLGAIPVADLYGHLAVPAVTRKPRAQAIG
jgi:hypothetical protein